MVAVAVALAAIVLVGRDEERPSEPHSFAFWPRDGASKAPGFERMEGPPCGEVAVVKVSKLPTAKDGPLETEIVVELDGSGKVIRRWPMPVNFTPHAIRAEELLVTAGDAGFWVREGGTFRREPKLPALAAKPVACDLSSVFGKSDYAACGVFVDLKSLKERTLGYQGVCT